MRLFLWNHNQVLTDIAKHFEITSDIFQADRVVVWNEVTPLAQELITFAHSFDIPVLTVQHGRRGSSRYFPPFNFPIISDKLCVWGKADKEALVKAGHPKEKIAVTGTTIFCHLKPRKKHSGTVVVFCPEHWDREVEENRLTAKELRRLKGVKIITKVIEGHNLSFYDNPVFSYRDDPRHLEIVADVLSQADIVVSIAEGTFELMAQYLDIPVVVMNEWKPKPFGGDKRYLNYRRLISPAAAQTSLKNLCRTVEEHLSHPEKLQEERKKIVIAEGGTDIANPLKELSNAISSLKRSR